MRWQRERGTVASPSGCGSRPASRLTPTPTSRRATWTPSSASPSRPATPSVAVIEAMRCPELTWSGCTPHRLADLRAGVAGRCGRAAHRVRGRDARPARLRAARAEPGRRLGRADDDDDPDAPAEPYIAALCAAITDACRQHGLALPHLVLEPGRSLVAPAGCRSTPSARARRSPACAPTSRWTAAWRTISGRRCTARSTQRCGFMGSEGRPRETGDHRGQILRVGRHPDPRHRAASLDAGDLLAIPMAGAYTLAMASNYNLSATARGRAGRARGVPR